MVGYGREVRQRVEREREENVRTILAVQLPLPMLALVPDLSVSCRRRRGLLHL